MRPLPRRIGEEIAMDIGVVRGILTLVLMLAFLGMVASVWSRRRAAEFEDLARMPLEDTPRARGATGSERE
jgi:cytochrome c oxidase cbb3-type subunit 4